MTELCLYDIIVLTINLCLFLIIDSVPLLGEQMATQNVNIGVNISDNGTANKTLKNVKDIHSELKATQKTAQSLNIPSTSAPSGMRAVYAKSAPTGSEQMMSGEDYGRARGSAGATGASARDFANQAQGLGGLVRLYATFAANVFAASAAFTALKNAADTANLVKGLDTLGAASGQALGSLSKRLVEVTDGAVSMREAMTATAQASSAGMSGKNIERLALVAKNASLALGVAMPDALNRLSRGIVKLEPELLDELGLFTKIGPATEKYALEIGKSATALTDFERRQAFANAVLDEGEKKFGALAEAAANPYDKLLANLKNVLQSGGELINKILVPIVSLLAESPAALAGVLAGIGYVLLKQALPAIGQLRAGLKNTAEEALKSAEAFKASFGDEFQTILEKRFKIPDLTAGVKKAEEDLAKLKVPSKLAGSVASLAAGEDVSAKNIKRVEEVLERKNLTAEKGMRGSKQASEAQIEQAKQEVAYIKAVIAVLKQKQALEAAGTGAQGVADIPPGRFDPEVIALQKYEKLRTKVDQANAISNAAQTAGIAGVRSSWDLLNKEVAEKGITGFAKYSTLAQGGLAAIGTRLMGVISSLGYVGQAVALATAAFAALDGIFSKNAKQAEAFNKAIGTAEESIANVSRTLQAATTVEGFGSKTIANTAALSNAFNELTASAKEALKTERAAASAAGGWDKFWNGVFTLAGKDRASKLADSIAKQISSSLDILTREGLADEYATEIKKILNVTNLRDIDSVARAWKNLSKDQQASVLTIQENSNRALGNASSALQGFKDKTDNALIAYKAFTNSFVDSSPLFKLGEAYIDVGQSLAQVAAAGPNRIAQAFEELANNSQKAALFGKDFVKAFAPIADEFKKQKAALDALNISLEKQVEARKNLSSASRVMTTESGAAIIGPNMGARTRQNSEIANENIRLTNRAIATINSDLLQKGSALITDAAKKAVDTGLALINRSIANARTTADINISKVISSVLTGPRKLEAENEIRQRELKLQLEDVKISESLINIQSSLVDEMKLANALQAEANAIQKGDKSAIERTALDAQRAKAAVGQTEGIDPKILAEVAKQQEENNQRRTKSLQSKRIAITGEMQASTLSTQLQMPGATLQQQEQLAKITDRKLAAERASLDVLTSIAGVTSNTTILAKQSAEASALKRSQDSEIATINKDIEAVELAKSKAKAQDIPRLDKELEVLDKIKKETQAAQKAENNTTGIKNRQELLSEELAIIGKRNELTVQQRDLENTFASGKLDYQAQELQLISATYGMSQKAVILRQAELDTQKAQLQTSFAISVAEGELQRKRDEATARITNLGGRGTEDAVAKQKIADIDAELARQQALFDVTKQKLTEEGSQRLILIDRAKSLNLEQERYNLLLETSNTAAESLKAVFGDLGSAIGGLVTSLSEVVVQNEKNTKALKDAAQAKQAAYDSQDIKRIADAEEAYDAQKRKSQKDELNGNIKLVSSAKTMFKEKTFAYKALDKVEKAMHVYRLAMDAKELAVKIGNAIMGTTVKAGAEATETGLTFAGVAARLPAYATEIYGNTIGQLGPIAGPVVATALVAAMFSMFGKGGGGGSTPAFSANSEQLQQTQGTGQTWNSKGERVADVGGILGDDEAKANSVVNSLEILQQNSFKSLDYDNRLLRSFQGVADAIGKATGTIITSGLRTVSDKIALMLGTSKEGGFGSSIPLIGNLLSSVFGGGYSESQTLQSQRLELSGTFSSVADNISSGLRQVTDVLVRWEEDGGWFGSDDSGSYIKRIAGTVPEDVKTVFSEVFSSLKSGYETIADLSGRPNPIGFVAEKLKTVNLVDSQGNPLKFDYTGLKGDEIRAELEAYFSKINNIALKALFPEFGEFTKAGEDYGTTAIRVLQNTRQVSNAFTSIDKSFNVTGLQAYRLSADLVRLSGGLDNFVDQAKFFADNFLTATERVVPVQKAVVAQLKSLGYESVDTKEEFKSLVQSLNVTTVAGQQAYQSLMDLAPGFVEVIDAVETQSQALKDAASNFRNFIVQIREFKNSLLLGASSTLTPGEKYAEARTQFDAIYAQALAGDKTAMGKVTSSAQTFLDASKLYFASSDVYTRDFNSVLTKLDDATISAGASASVAELQLNALSIHTSLLTSIDSNIAAIAGVPGLAGGGRASGLTLVGEMGPELVDFTMPGRVYSADQTAGMFTPMGGSNQAMGAVVAELQQLRQEVSQLRKDQQKQTGDLIISNYDANQKASEEIATAVVSTSKEMVWVDRSKSEIK